MSERIFHGTNFVFPVALAAALLLVPACSLFSPAGNLNSVDAEFLSKVRYIITGEERKIFLELPESARDRFKEEFWQRRDSDPETEENEFRELYLSRLEEAVKLFSAGKPGWMTDRGEIYILFGPPTNKESYPMGRGPGTHPTEIWYYGYFPIIFIDYQGTGDFARAVEDVIYLHEVNKALEIARQTLNFDISFLEFSIKYEKKEQDQFLVIRIPYDNVWLRGTPGGAETVLELSIEILDSGKQPVWNFQQNIALQLTDEELQTHKGKTLLISIPFKLDQGEYMIHAVLVNTTDKKEGKKALKIKI